MHQPSTSPRPSLYYDYRVFPPWLPDSRASAPRVPVAIVGAGPTGLVTALELARHGVTSIVLAAELQVSEGSRAIVFTRRSLEILQQVGVADRIVREGLPWRCGSSFYRGQRVFRMEAPCAEDDRFAPMTNIQQQYLEEYLLDACAAEPLIELRWGNKLVGITEDTDGAVLSIDTPAGVYAQACDWVVAADGGRSWLRGALDLELEGDSYEGLFVIADIRVDLPLPTERLAFFDPSWNRGNTVLMHREPHGIWRVDYQLPPGETPADALAPAALAARIDAQLAMIGHGGIPWALDWCSVYSARALTLASYVHGRVLFAGDAAHLLPIFGVRGANTAFQDAQALGWRLAFVVKELAGGTLLGNYSDERVGAAREIIEEAGKSTRFMTPPGRGWRLLRDAVLSLSLTQEFVRPLYHWRTSRPHEYTGSALNCATDDDDAFSAGPAHGAAAPNVRLGAHDYLLDHLGGAFDLLCFTDAASLPARLIATIDAIRARGIPLRVTAIGAQPVVAGANSSLADPAGRCRARYGVRNDGAAYLLRPDQHVCARWLRLDPAQLHGALATALAAPGALT